MVQVPDDALEPEFDEVDVTLTSTGDALVSKQVTLTTRVMYAIEIEAESSEQTGAPDETVIYNVTITNTGPGTSGTYNLSLSGNLYSTWSSEAIIGPLASGESITIQIMVHIPPQALDNQSDTVTVKLTSASNPLASKQITLTTRVTSPYKWVVFFPVVMVP
jgi:uncharacterized membrane protein